MIRVRSKVVVAAMLFVVMTASVAFGYNVYNFTSYVLGVMDLDTGSGCATCYGPAWLNPQTHGSCPGNDDGCGSPDNIVFGIPTCTNPNCGGSPVCYVGTTVTNHGWVGDIWNLRSIYRKRQENPIFTVGVADVI
ncbi:hypothetical protein, partial [Candidatus Magnetominusculus dajiuhuensis]|uniref:hypothetical protein n=1 Tax=Candidatus Magnetominusculus dajiuhuensis TaxID=3137712 RepID=UPI003B4302D3